MKIGALITAAGMSSRMGKFKPLLRIGNKTVAQRIVETLRQAGAEQIVMVTGNHAEALEEHLSDSGIIFLRNEDYATTQMFDSVKIGLSYLQDRCDRVLFTPVDVPLFSADTVCALLNSGAELACPVCAGQTGHPIMMAGRLLPEILAHDGTRGLKGALERCSSELVQIPVEDPGIIYDADTPADFDRLLRLYENRSMKKRVYLIRHCRPDFPAGKMMCLGSTDLPLGAEGHRQAEELKNAMSHIPLTAVFCSALKRSAETAGYLSDAPTVLPGLEELDAGAWDGLTFDQIRAQYPALYAARGDDPSIPIPGCEPDDAGLARFTRAMEQAAQRAGGDFAVVAHAGVMCLFLKSLGLSGQKPPYGGVTPLLWENGSYYGEE